MNDNSKVTFRFSDNMPNVCVACSAQATGATIMRVRLPMDMKAKQMTLIQSIGLLLGFFIYRLPGSQETPSEQFVTLPTCNRHLSSSVVSNLVALSAIDRFSANLFGSSPEFQKAFAALNAPPSPELLASLDTGKPVNLPGFFQELSKSDLQGPADFLKKLERDS